MVRAFFRKFVAVLTTYDMGKMTEEDRLMRRINQRFMKGVMNYKLIEEGDRILVGLSGGKDSLALLELLALTFAHLQAEAFRWWRRTW